MIEAFVGELFFNLNIKLKLIWTNRDIKELVMAKSEIKKIKKCPSKTKQTEMKKKLNYCHGYQLSWGLVDSAVVI